MGSSRIAGFQQRIDQALEAGSYARRTREAYRLWIRRYVDFCGLQNFWNFDLNDIDAFLAHLMLDGSVSASGQNQAHAALGFLFGNVLGIKFSEEQSFCRAPRNRAAPLVLSRSDANRLLARIEEPSSLVAGLLYGCGLRLIEALKLRVRDLDLTGQTLIVRDHAEHLSRQAPLPSSLLDKLRDHLKALHHHHLRDLENGGVHAALDDQDPRLPSQLGRAWEWQWLFPGRKRHDASDGGRVLRHHLHPTIVQRAIRKAAQATGLTIPVTCRTLRHSFAIELLSHGHTLTTVQELMGHSHPGTTRQYLSALTSLKRYVRSPLDSP